MTWLGLIVGGLIGLAFWGWRAAFVLAFLGWLAGVIVASKRAPKPTATTAPIAPMTDRDRIARLEKSLASIELRLSRLEQSSPSPLGEGRGEGPQSAPSPLGEGRGEGPRELLGPAPISEPSPEPAPPPRAPSPPNPLIAWITGGNAIARVGLLILFFGLAFLLKYAADRDLIPIELRVGGVAAVGIALLVGGWRLRHKRAGYALGLQGAGVGVLYLTTFAALRLYHLLPAELAFFLLVAIAVLSAFIAVAQDSPILAAFGAGGGFLAPILASTGGGSHVMLFSYYLVLNLGILAIALFKAWRGLNVMGFLFTFFIGLAWGLRYYRSDYFGTTEPFLIAFFVLYVVVAILFSWRQATLSPALPQGGGSTSPTLSPALPQGGGSTSPTLSPALSQGRGSTSPTVPPALPQGSRSTSPTLSPALPQGGGRILLVDATLVFGTPLAAFGLQAALTRTMEFGLAWSCVAAAAFYLVLAAMLRKSRASMAMLAEAFLALSLVFITLAIPLALDARWTSAAWALEGAAIVWFGIRQQRRLARAFGLLLQIGAAVAYLWALSSLRAETPIVDAPFVGGVLLAIAGLWIARLFERHRERVTKGEAGLVPFAFLWGVGWWLFAAFNEVDAFVPYGMRLNADIAVLAATALASSLLALRLRWNVAAWPALALMPALALCLASGAVSRPHPFGDYGWLAWIFAIAVQVWVLRRNADETPPGYGSVLHTGTVLILAALGALELHWLAAEYTARGTAWSVAAVMVVPALLVLAIASRGMDDRWPVAIEPRAYRVGALAPLVVALGIWVIFANITHDGRSDPLPYLPLVNALDLGHVLAALAFAWAWLGVRRRPNEFPRGLASRESGVVVAALAFLWLNGILLRSIHHWGSIPYRLEPMMRSVVVQAALSIFWTVLALALMVAATRMGRRGVWMTGAALMGVVVVKLFTIDLSHVGGVERIVSFIGVGLLMLVVGWFAPVPPRRAEVRT